MTDKLDGEWIELFGRDEPQVIVYLRSKILVDLVQDRQLPLTDVFVRNLGQLEALGGDDMRLFFPALRIVEQARLGDVIGERIRTAPYLHRVGDTPGNSPVLHRPHHHMGRFGHQGDKIPERIVCGRRLGDLAIGLRLNSTYQVGEVHRILDKENRDIVAYQVVIALFGIELNGEAPCVPRQDSGAFEAGDGREAEVLSPFMMSYWLKVNEVALLFWRSAKANHPAVLYMRSVWIEAYLRSMAYVFRISY